MSLGVSALCLALSVAGFVGFSAIDKRSGQDRLRVAVLLCGIMGMISLFYLIINLLIGAGLL